MNKNIPLTLHHTNDSIIAWNDGKPITHAQFISHIHDIAEQLENKPYVINLVENRYLFMVSLAASLLKHQTSLLPQTRAPENIFDIQKKYPDCYYLSDNNLNYEGIQHCPIDKLKNSIRHNSIPEIKANHLALITFTSGSTGTPEPHKKYWCDLVAATNLAAQRFGLYKEKFNIVATVPPQHMYGLETSVLFPLLTGNAIYGSTPFYPEDIDQVFCQLEGPSFLVTTPVHLQACMRSNIQWKNINFVISATATLSESLAKDVQLKMQTQVSEIFGCTEAGSIASRTTINTNVWEMYDGIQLIRNQDKTEIIANHIREKTILQDNIKLLNDHEFIHLGRSNDMVNIAGKRGSLTNLTLKLKEIDIVTDGAFFLPPVAYNGTKRNSRRLTAFVVAPDTSEKEIIKRLLNKIDPVFLPRPLYIVDQLPYNSMGKLTLAALKELYYKVSRGKVCHH